MGVGTTASVGGWAGGGVTSGSTFPSNDECTRASSAGLGVAAVVVALAWVDSNEIVAVSVLVAPLLVGSEVGGGLLCGSEPGGLL